MASTSSALELSSLGSQDNNASDTTMTISSVIDIKNDNVQEVQLLQCFVCDVNVKGRYYALATCRTQNSRSRVIEKLGELVGERYMVVISEDDVVCRSCANLINTLDRLETEMRMVRENILRFLERKYSLQEGELLGNCEKPKPCQPPQITKRNVQSSDNRFKKKDDIFLSNVTDYNKNKKNVWLQCDKCKYTTHHNSFMVHHTKGIVKQKIFCDKCGMPFSEDELKIHECKVQENSNNIELPKEQEKQKEFPVKSINNSSVDMPIVEKGLQENLSMLPFHSYPQLQISTHDNTPVIRLTNSGNFSLQNMLGQDTVPTPSQPMYVRVLQHININDNIMHAAEMPPVHTDAEIMTRVKDNSTKQLLTLTEDGNLEMVEVSCWNDVQSSDPEPDIHF